jgi:hypothetical protein
VNDAAPWRPGTKVAKLREEATRRVLAGQPLADVKKALKLDNVDERLVADHVRNLDVAQRRDRAVQLVLQGHSLEDVQVALHLSKADARVVAGHVKDANPWMALLTLEPDDDDWCLCPGVSPHPATPITGRIELRWCDDSPGDGRVVEWTCSCVMTHYELVSYGGLYRIRRHTVPRRDVPPISYTGGWRRPEGYEWWRRLLAGQAR